MKTAYVNSMNDWNASQYEKFIRERTLPAKDLANKIYCKNPKMILDIGCGTGNSTKVLKDRFPQSRVIGADSSSDMLAKARANHPELDFIAFDASCDFDHLETKFDIVFSNACMQWIPDHEKFLKNIMQILNAGGMLAVQIPMNYKEPIHLIIRELADSEKWNTKFGTPRVFYNLTQSAYFDILSEISRDFSIWETVYFHRMPSHQSIMEWYKGTGLRPYLSVLSPDDALDFENDVFQKIEKAYPMRKNGEIIFRFPRFFFTAQK